MLVSQKLATPVRFQGEYPQHLAAEFPADGTCCNCFGVSNADVADVVTTRAASGQATAKADVTEATRACRGCHGCGGRINKLLAALQPESGQTNEPAFAGRLRLSLLA